MKLLSVFLLAIALVPLVLGAVYKDLITDLPGLTWTVNFKQYSGYLKANGNRLLHYWFVESQGNPASDPLVLWLNGGPGCSSLDGLLSEHGPFGVHDDGQTLYKNPNSWNTIANMLYLEAPAGVGYSYATDNNVTTDDDQVAKDNHQALRSFLAAFPEFSSNEFFITGESYGGIYVPTLASLVVDDSSFNFKGFAVGNGLSDASMNDNSLIYFAYYHGLFATSTWDTIVKYCCKNGCSTRENCDFTSNPTGQCQDAVIDGMLFLSELNIYNLYAECYRGPDTFINNKTLIHPHEHYLLHSLPKVKAKFQRKLAGGNVNEVPPCVNVRGSTTYLNRAEVRHALHIPDSLPEWAVCSNLPYGRIYNNMRAQYMKILATKKQRILVYNGDVDMACNYLGDQWFTNSLDLPLMHNRTLWHYTAEDKSSQVAGYAKVFEGLTFATVKGSGHMVPQDKPVPALVMFTNFIKNKPFK